LIDCPLKAIKDTGNTLLAALDPFDSMGILDKYFLEADFSASSKALTGISEHLRETGACIYRSILIEGRTFGFRVVIRDIPGRKEAERIEEEYIRWHIEEYEKRPRGNR